MPDEERTSPPSEFAWVWHAAQFSFGTVVLGALPITFGLSWWAGLASIVTGATIGGLLIASLVRFGTRTGCSGVRHPAGPHARTGGAAVTSPPPATPR